MNWPTFFTRLGSAIVFAAVMMCGLLWKDWMFVILIAIIQILCLRDYFRLMLKIYPEDDYKGVNILVQIFGVLLLFLVGFPVFLMFPHTDLLQINKETTMSNSLILRLFYHTLAYWPVLICFPILIMVISFLTNRGSLISLLKAAGAFIYIILPCALLMKLHNIAWYLPLVLILMIWMNDTMAYIVGSFIGKTPFSKISPKKTWEGTAGGAILTVVGAAVCTHYIPNQSMPLYIAFALCAAIAGTAGDLFESKLKRVAGVKDSGTMMPGHGGALDRFDSLLVATPFAFCVAYLWLILIH